tara:strand:+ start:1721 stop:2626 length:906 start_codon:yes stop_codon:yes gene_type:complete
MNNINKLGAIDIGSNAVRLLIASVTKNKKETRFKKISLVRVPLRLGKDVFSKGRISLENIKKLQKTIRSFKILMEMHQVKVFEAVATSAMREASNSKNIIGEINKKFKIKINLISGKNEAMIVANVFLNSNINSTSNYLFVDVGGGSTELNLISEKKLLKSKSFKIGTVRMLNDNTSVENWKKFKNWINESTNKFNRVIIVGSGGNASKILKIAEKNTFEVITIRELEEINELVNSMSFHERVEKLQLNVDRADVIVPAMNIYLKAMEYSNSEAFLVPRIGLVDGLIRQIYLNEKQGQKLN